MRLTTSPLTRDRRVALPRSPPTGLFLLLEAQAIFSFSRSMLSTLTSIFWSILTSSLGWLTRPHDMSVMCSRPSMPPRSTNAPKSAMFLTVPLTMSPSLRVSSRRLFASLALFSMSLRRRDDDVATLGVDLEDLGADLERPMNSPMSWGRRMSTCEAGRKTGHADVDEQAALDLPHAASPGRTPRSAR
jgi:hypothetical protein